MSEREEKLEAEVRRLFAKWSDEVVRADDLYKEVEAWRRTNPQYFYDPSAGAIFRDPETLPPHMRPARN